MKKNNRGLTVGDIVSACEYISCDVFNQIGTPIAITDENASDIYSRSVEHIDACDGKVRIFTFDNMDKLIESFCKKGV